MNEINFLPESYRRRQSHRRQRARRWTLVAALFCCAALGWVMQQQQTASLADQAATIARQVQAVQNAQLEVNRLSERRDVLVRQVTLKRKLGMGLLDSQVINVLGSHLPANVGLTDLSLRKLDRGAGDGGGKKGAKWANRLEVTFQGMAPKDVVVANLLSSLSRDPLFSHVTMRFSRPVTDGGVTGRAFGLSMRVNLDRRFEFGQGQRGER